MTYREAIETGTRILQKENIADAKIDAWYLLQMLNDQANQALADKYMKTFNSMISETRS